jgi:hypothetical protein
VEKKRFTRYVCLAAFAPLADGPPPHCRNMKLQFDHISQTAVAALAAAIAISLSIFLLSGAGGQSQAVPLLPALGGAAERVTAELEPPAHVGATQAHPTAPVQVRAPVVFRPAVVVPSAVKHGVHRTHRTHRTHAPVVRSRPAALAQAAASAPPRTTPVATHVVPAAPWGEAKGKAKAHGHAQPKAHGHPKRMAHGYAKPKSHGHAKPKAHGRSHAAKTLAVVQVQGHRHGKAHGHAKAARQGTSRGHSSEKHQALPPGQAKKARVTPTAPPALPASPPHGNGHGVDGHGGGKK